MCDSLEETVKKYSSLDGFDCGIFAADALIRVLFENGKADLAFKLLTSHKEKASYGYMMDCGATTFWEYMTGMASHNHPMFSAPVSSFFKYLLGILIVRTVVKSKGNSSRCLGFAVKR